MFENAVQINKENKQTPFFILKTVELTIALCTKIPSGKILGDKNGIFFLNTYMIRKGKVEMGPLLGCDTVIYTFLT